MNLLEVFIFIIHLFIILFVVVIPFTNIPVLWVVNIAGTLCLMVHWYFNNNTCFLSIVESKLKGVEMKETFIYRLVSPVYDIQEYTLNKIIWIVTILSLIISVYKLVVFYNKVKDNGFKLKYLISS